MDAATICLEKLKVQNEAMQAKDAAFIRNYKQLKQACLTLQTISGRTPRGAPLVLKLRDFQSTFQSIKQAKMVASEKVRRQSLELEKFEADCAPWRDTLENLASTLTSVKFEARMNESQAARLLLDLSAAKRELAAGQASQLHIQEELDHRQQFIDDRICQEQKKIEELENSIREIDAEIESFPERMKLSVSERERIVAKRKQLVHEIQRKIDGVHQEIQAKQWQSVEVMTMTATLEAHWRDHAKMLDTATDYENRLHVLQGLVERKRKIVSALQETQVRKTSHTGIRHLDLIYSAAAAQNRDLAQGMREIKREVSILEAEQVQFLMELAV
jgi:chromosome segregation ATPase